MACMVSIAPPRPGSAREVRGYVRRAFRSGRAITVLETSLGHGGGCLERDTGTAMASVTGELAGALEDAGRAGEGG